MFKRCQFLPAKLSVETILIQRYLEEQKAIYGMMDRNDAIMVIVGQFGWLMGEEFCGFVCIGRLHCLIAQPYLPETSEKEEEPLVRVYTTIKKRHFDIHKWCNHIADPEIAEADFKKKFGWFMEEMLKTPLPKAA